jgi:hypothetical protein
MDHIAQRFEWSVRALAQPVEIQIDLYPEFVCVSDELALEFDEWRRRLFDCAIASNWPDAATRLIEVIDQQLEAMSGQANEQLWSDQALAASAEWNQVRDLSRQLILEMNWTDEPPPAKRDIFVGPL